MLWNQPTKKENREYNRKYREAHPERVLLTQAKVRAKRAGLAFNLSESDIVIPDVCPYLKTPFIPGTMYAASLDKIIPSEGYVRGNVEVISRKANVMKSNASTEELLEFAYTILERN